MSINTEFILRTGFYDYEQTAESSGYNKNCYLEEKSNEEKRDAALLRYNKIKKNFNFSSIDAKYISTSGCFSCTSLTPSGEEIKHINLIFLAPLFFNKEIASAAEPPVANIGSTTIISLSAIS